MFRKWVNSRTSSNYVRKLQSIPPCRVFASHFSGHGVVVAGRKKIKLPDESPYVVWDGKILKRYEPTEWHECIVCTDYRLISLQRHRLYVAEKGFEPIILFPCKIGEPTLEVNVPNDNGILQWNGLATYCRLKVFNKIITTREFISQANLVAEGMGFDQVGEVLCREELLDDILFEPEYNIKPVYIWWLDMCRVFGEYKDFKVTKDIFSP